MRVLRVVLLLVASFSVTVDAASDVKPALPDLYEASVTELQVNARLKMSKHFIKVASTQAALDAGHFTSVELVKVRFPLILHACYCFKVGSILTHTSRHTSLVSTK